MLYLIILIILTIIFIYHVETSVGNILFRYNSSGQITINIFSLLHFMIHPLKNTFLWNSKLIDINYIFYFIIFNLLYLIMLK